MKACQRIILLLVVATWTLGWTHRLGAQPRPTTELLIAWPFTLAPAWFDPAETPAQITPFAVLFALHDALVRPLPGERMGNSLAQAWSESPDGLVYEFKLRQGLRFHNGEPCTAEDVKFSFERYRGTGATELHDVVNYLNAVGIRVAMRPMERAPFYAAWRERKLRGLFVTGAGASGNAATRVEAFISSKGAYAYGGYPDIDALFQQQAVERDRATRRALLQRIQQLTVKRVMFAPIIEFRPLHGMGPRVAEHTINAIPMHPFPSYEDLRLKGP